MFNLSSNNIHLSAQASDKSQAIQLVAQALENSGYVEAGYLQGMLAREQQTSTFLGNGIAIPHGTLDTRHMVKNTGVQVFQFPQGIEWGEGNKAYVVIGIAARSDEHLALLRQLTHVLGDEDTAASLAHLQDVEKFRAILMGEKELDLPAENISLDVDSQSLLALTAINAGKLQQQGAVDAQFVAETISSPALPLCQGIWLTDSVLGNLQNAIAFSRAKQPFHNNGKLVHGVLTIAAANDQINSLLARLLEQNVQQVLLNGNSQQILVALLGKTESDKAATAVPATPTEATQSSTNQVVGCFTVRNEHGLHARPTTALVNVVKGFNAKITVENLTRESAPVSAKSLMKIVSLGAVHGHRLRFVAEGEDAQAAIEAIQKAMQEGLGEQVSAVPPQVEDSIEVLASANAAPASTAPADNAVEGIFTIHNEHGLHARPTTVLVNEVKKYNASVAVQNLDRESQLVSAKSLIKVVALGATKGQRLRFVATGEEAQQAIDGIGAAIAAGLGE